MSQDLCIVFRLGPDVSRHYRFFCRVISLALNAENAFKLDFGSHKIV